MGRSPCWRRTEAHAGTPAERSAPFAPGTRCRAPCSRDPPCGRSSALLPLSRLFPVVRSARAASSRGGLRVIEFSVQEDHIHLIAEAADGPSLASGLRGLAIRVARAVNHALGRRGRVFGDRYHARALTTPRAVRNALVYVLMNFRKHLCTVTGCDPCSSAAWFTGWRTIRVPHGADAPPVSRAQTWLGRVGWRRHGLIDPSDRPRSSPRRSD